ncbi:hypothetical protein [Streptomyces sp. NPDC004675]|uniref:hypothetical protein n=1 Tax=unclassified Streptomyces TaxID=2593676 RepID=UPI0033AD353B
MPAAVSSTAALVLCAWTLGGAVPRQTRAFRAATAEAARRATAGDLCVIGSPGPDAHAPAGRSASS